MSGYLFQNITMFWLLLLVLVPGVLIISASSTFGELVIRRMHLNCALAPSFSWALSLSLRVVLYEYKALLRTSQTGNRNLSLQ